MNCDEGKELGFRYSIIKGLNDFAISFLESKVTNGKLLLILMSIKGMEACDRFSIHTSFLRKSIENHVETVV